MLSPPPSRIHHISNQCHIIFIKIVSWWDFLTILQFLPFIYHTCGLSPPAYPVSVLVHLFALFTRQPSVEPYGCANSLIQPSWSLSIWQVTWMGNSVYRSEQTCYSNRAFWRQIPTCQSQHVTQLLLQYALPFVLHEILSLPNDEGLRPVVSYWLNMCD